MARTLRAISILFLCIIFAVLPSLNMDSLMNSTQSGKSILFLWGIGIISSVSIIRFWLSPELEKISISIIDLLLFTYILYILIQNNWVELTHSLQFLELTGLTILYFLIRQYPSKSYLWLLLAIITGGTIQAIYGNLQLWGYFPSHHGIFKMTGSFFNPGPYSGYLVAVFPISLGFYLINIPISVPAQHPVVTRTCLYSSLVKAFFRRIPFVNYFFNNKGKEEYTREKQVEMPKHTYYFTMKSFALTSIISMCLVLPASRSRAAWLAALVSSFYLLSVKYQLHTTIKLYFNTRIKQLGLISFLAILLTTTIFALYYFKKGSADGRLLIWEVSAGMIKDKPLRGHGYDGFKINYMDYQAVYFKQSQDSKKALVAGDTNYAFNELIQLTVENGIVGVLPLIAIIFFLLFGKVKPLRSGNLIEKSTNSNDRLATQSSLEFIEHINHERFLIHISRAIIISILVFSLFSYPLQILPIKICLIFALTISARITSQKVNINFQMPIQLKMPLKISIKSIISAGLLGLLGVAIIHLKLTETAYSNWKTAFDQYNMGLYDDCLVQYEKAYPVLKTNGDFLTNYGKALSIAEKPIKAMDILLEATHYYSNIIVFTALGDNYKKMGQTNQAEQAYLHAWYMNPSRFYPKYLLVKLYDESGQKKKATDVAKELLSKKTKINSAAVEEIKEEMRKIIGKNNS